MFSQLTLDHSLYVIEEDLLEEFKSFESTLPPSFLKESRVHKQLDRLAIAFNLWLFMYEDRKSLYFNVNKIMPYASNFYIFNQLRKNKKLEEYIEHILDLPEMVFVFANILDEVLLDWVYKTLSNNEDTQTIMAINGERDYFTLADEELMEDTRPEHIIYKQQKLVTQLLATNIVNTGDFENAIVAAIKASKNFKRMKQKELSH